MIIIQGCKKCFCYLFSPFFFNCNSHGGHPPAGVNLGCYLLIEFGGSLFLEIPRVRLNLIKHSTSV